MIFFIFNFFFAILFFYGQLFALMRFLRIGLLSPFLFVYVFLSPVFLMKNFIAPYFLFEFGVADYWFNYSLLMSNLEAGFYFLYFCIGLFFASKVDFSKFLFPRSEFLRFSLVDVRFLSLGYFFLSMLLMIFLMVKTIGVLEWASNPREGYQFHRVGNGHIYALGLFFLSMSLIFLSVSTVGNIWYAIIFSGLLAFSFLYGAKAVILALVTFFAVFLYFRRVRYMSLIFLMTFVCGFGLMLANFGSFDFERISAYFDYHVNSAMFYEYMAREGEYLGGEVFLTSFWEMVPRSFYPDKPYVYGEIILREIFWPGAAENTHTPGMAGPVAVYADFGVLGVLLESLFQVKPFFLAFCSCFAYRGLELLFRKPHEFSARGISFLLPVCVGVVFLSCYLEYFSALLSILLLLGVWFGSWFYIAFFRSVCAVSRDGQ